MKKYIEGKIRMFAERNNKEEEILFMEKTFKKWHTNFKVFMAEDEHAAFVEGWEAAKNYFNKK